MVRGIIYAYSKASQIGTTPKVATEISRIIEKRGTSEIRIKIFSSFTFEFIFLIFGNDYILIQISNLSTSMNNIPSIHFTSSMHPTVFD